jgi:hypothetical protein
MAQGLTGSSSRTTASTREILTSNRTLYVRTDGSDLNDGLEDTPQRAFLTIQQAVNVAGFKYDLGQYNLTVKVANGTYNVTTQFLPGYLSSSGRLIIEGNTSSPSGVVISSSGGSCFYTGGFGNSQVTSPKTYIIRGFRFVGTSSAFAAINVGQFGNVVVEEMEYGSGFNTHLWANNGGQIVIRGNYSITGGATHHMYMRDGACIRADSAHTVTLTGTPAFSSIFAFATACSLMRLSALTYSGSATGGRYRSEANSHISVGGSATFFPGSIAGVTATGGLYL